jgi:hypothetical protein
MIIPTYYPNFVQVVPPHLIVGCTRHPAWKIPGGFNGNIDIPISLVKSSASLR